MINTSQREASQNNRSALVLMALVISGEAIFFLPFMIPRVFRPTFLSAFGLSNLELGIAFSVYGTVAMISYFLGGWLADIFAPRKLMSTALLLTGLGGLLMINTSSLQQMTWIYGAWGATTILLFWAAMIRATRAWGGKELQGRAFGFLDSGRGLSAAVTGSLALWLFSFLLPGNGDSPSTEQLKSALENTILAVSIVTILTALLVWVVLPKAKSTHEQHAKKIDLRGITKVVQLPTLWLISAVIVSGYVGYKITDDFSLFAKDVLGYDDVNAAKVGTLALWIRPVTAFVSALLADKYKSSYIIFYSFVIVILSSLSIGLKLNTSMVSLYIILIASTGIGVFAIRSLYFALLEEGNIPFQYTGTAVGIISVIGFTPDIFMGPLMGRILDQTPGAQGHYHLFLTLACFSLLGFLASLLFLRSSRKSS